MSALESEDEFENCASPESHSHEHKTLVENPENQCVKIERLENDLQVKEKVIENQKIKIEELLDGLLEMDNLETKLKEVETELYVVKSTGLAAISEVSLELKYLKAQLEQEREKGMCPHFFESCFAE